MKWLFFIVLGLLPFSVYESVTGQNILLDLFDKIFNVYNNATKDPRFGFERAQASMPHPILFGVFCSPAFALVWYTLRSNDGNRGQIWRPAAVVLAVLTSLSSGAFLSIMVQFFLSVWNSVFQNVQKKWNILAAWAGLAYLVIEVFSNRTAFEIIASHLTFSKATAWTRIIIFNNASDDVMNNPIFGIGLGDWTRPVWLKSSVDNFWLLIALRYGLPALIIMLVILFLLFRRIGRAPLSGALATARTGYLISVFGISFAVISVHMWDATYCLYMFFLGAGIWFIDAQGQEEIEGPIQEDEASDRKIRYTRFPVAEAQI
ncbi:hypothetical protein [Pseudohalocynthiibacter sp. F2068]|uniref:O-antigen ligase family protein n=1 Tax=Pseudohalocynthiibacter sp. F2068 TaxID=2926418 RepID=UPI001FF1E5D2|nr:hypothetical protein [Pseudohalocynthiibacter sp. F2068]